MIVYSYLLYLVITLAVTIWVGNTLHKNGRAFLVDAFQGNDSLADSVNHLLVVGFYLVNVGYVCFVLTMARHPENFPQAIELLSKKLGGVLIMLGLMHFFNIYLFNRYRNGALLKHAANPAQPTGNISA